MKQLLLIAAAATALSLTSCDVPVNATVDTAGAATRIEGTVRVFVDNGLPLGPAVLFRYDCDNPPAPIGSGRPVDFLIVSDTEFTNGQADFIFPAVPADSCVLIGGFLDRDRDFHYAFTMAAQATAGDVSIPLVEVLTEPLGDDDYIEPTTGVLLRAEIIEPYDRPAFELPFDEVPIGDDDDSAAPTEIVYPSMELGETSGSTVTRVFDLQLRPLVSDLVEVDDPIFAAILGTDLDENGIPDDDNGDGRADVDWPRVLLFRLDPDDPTGATESDPQVVITGVVMSSNPFAPLDAEANLITQAGLQGIPFDGVTPLYRETLKIAVPGLVITSSVPLVLAPIEDIAASGTDVLGRYRVLVMNANGQLWYIPNELVDFGVADQGGYFSVVDEDD